MDSYYSLSSDDVLFKLKSSKSGLTDIEAEKRLIQYGENKLTAKKKISALKIFIDQFKNTLTLILIISSILIVFIYFFGNHDKSDLIEAGLILAIVFLMAILGFVQEFKAERAIESLKKLLAYKTKVVRDGKEKIIDSIKLVPGDIIILEEGEKIPSDTRLLEVYSLSANEASLTGESAPVRKITDAINGKKQIHDQKNMVFAGCNIASGRAIGIVVETSDNTQIGKIARLVAETVDEPTPIQKKLDKIGKTLGFIILGVCSIVFIFIVFLAKDFTSLPLLERVIQSFIASVSLAVAAIPEGLPAVVTVTLALGTQRMLKKKALVRKLSSVETLGSVDVICSDKTGTLTKGEMTVKKIYQNGEIYDVSGVGYELKGDFSNGREIVGANNFELLLEIGMYCNNSRIDEKQNVTGDPTEVALLVSALKAGIKTAQKRLFEVPFSSERKKMSVVVEKDKKYYVFVKGAPEIVLKSCIKVSKKGVSSNITKPDRDKILDANLNLSKMALRNLAFAYKEISSDDYKKNLKDESRLEENLTFVGLQCMIDPPRSEVKPLIDQCQTSGIRVVMITGDHIETAKAIARDIGIKGEALSGEELENIRDDDFSKTVDSISIYARVNPSSKTLIVDQLKKKGHIVAMTGDGVNDAPALKKADIGIAMGITGTDVAKESSDMVLLDDHFGTIISAIEEGRGIYHNIRKFVHYLLSCNIGEVLIVFFAVVLFQEFPLSAIMLLWINIVTDGLPAIALGLDPAEKDILKLSPKIFQTEILSKKLWIEMTIFGFLLTISTLIIYIFNLSEGMIEAKSAAFCTIVVLELINVYIIRSNYKTSFWSNKWLIGAVLASFALQLLIVYNSFFSQLFGIKHVNINDWMYIFIASLIAWIFFKILRFSLYFFRN